MRAHITVAELDYGVSKSRHATKNRLALAQFLSLLEVASFDRDAAAACGRVRATLEQKGTPIGAMDLLIAAHALSLDVRLVTNNAREFRRVPGLRVENWVQACIIHEASAAIVDSQRLRPLNIPPTMDLPMRLPSCPSRFVPTVASPCNAL
jgi:tRNA(fMet)-specific endonuclease VapC